MTTTASPIELLDTLAEIFGIEIESLETSEDE